MLRVDAGDAGRWRGCSGNPPSGLLQAEAGGASTILEKVLPFSAAEHKTVLYVLHSVIMSKCRYIFAGYIFM